MLSIIIILTTIAQLLLALFVYLKGRNNLNNIIFSVLSLAMLGWALSNYAAIRVIQTDNFIILIRSIMFFVVVQNTLFYVFARLFPLRSWPFSKRKLWVYLFFSVVTLALTLSPYLFTSVKIENGLPVTTAGPAIPVFILHAGFSIVYAFKSLFQKRRKASGVHKRQLNLIILASILTWVVVPITNFAISPLLQTTFFVLYGPIYTLGFASLMGYAIVAQKLFDIRAAIARSVAYILIIGTLAFIYSISLFGLVNNIFDAPDQELTRQVLSVVLVVPLIFSFEKIKQFFNRVSNKLFYQDAYDPQQFLNSLNNVLVGNIELKSLLQESAELIEETMKCEFCAFSIQGSKKIPQRIIGSGNTELKQEDIVEVANVVDKQRHKLIVTDEIESVNSKLKKKLLESNITVAKRMYTTGSTHQEIGYLIFGGKKSGNPYSKEDIRVIEIISNELVIAIQNALRFEEIQEFTVTLQDKVNEATRDLRKANEKLKALDETKDEFISMASHQLRTPLTSVKGYLSMVVEGDVGKISKQQKDLLNQAFSSSQRMVYLIADLLNVSRLRTGKFVIENKPTQLAEAIEAEMAQLQEVANSKNQTLTYKKPAKFPVMSLDETKIRQVIMNFTDNALHYTPKDGHIEVKLEDLGNSIQFTVVDDGLGVPKNEQHHLFSKFYRAGNAKKARPDGTGLGLFMAKKVIIAQGGAIIFKSEENKGSTFGFTMPKKGHLAEKTTEK